VAATVYAQRCDELKERYLRNSKSKEPSFVTQFNALWQLSNLGRLSRHNCIWLGKRIHEMSEAWGQQWHEQNQIEMVDQLRDRHARAWKRWEKRIEERAAAKAARAEKRAAKGKTVPVAPTAPEGFDPWDI
jgi:hypothetical protein